MKLNLLSNISSVGRTLVLAAMALLATVAANAQAPSAPGTNFFNDTINGVNLGATSGGATLGHKSWAIFALSGGVTITDSVNTYGDPLSYDVYGNVAIAGSGALSMTNSWIRGGITVQNNAQVTPSGAPFFTGARTVDTSFGTPGTGAVAQANAASAAAGGLANDYSTGLTALAYSGGSIPTSISLATAAAFVGAANTTYVINLTDLSLSGAAAQLTLNGTSTTNYIFNISRFLTLSNQAKIILGGGGITEANVLYNVKTSTPQYDVGLSGGSELHGIILAPTRNVKLTGGSKVVGEVIAKGVSLSGVSKVINPFASP